MTNGNFCTNGLLEVTSEVDLFLIVKSQPNQYVVSVKETVKVAFFSQASLVVPALTILYSAEYNPFNKLKVIGMSQFF